MLKQMVLTKGQLISKFLFGVINFFQKTNKNKSTWVIIVVKSNFFVRFWKNWRYQKVLLKLTDLYQIFIGIIPTFAINFVQINQVLPQLQPQMWFEAILRIYMGLDHFIIDSLWSEKSNDFKSWFQGLFNNASRIRMGISSRHISLGIVTD